jgi:MFS family permease
MLKLPEFQVLRGLDPDARLLFSTRIARLFAYGSLSVILVLYLARAGLNETQIGLLLTLTLVGDTIISLYIATHADRTGRRLMLLVGAGLMLFAAILFALTRDFVMLLIAATIGVISPSGNEVGPFLSIEQAALSQTVRSTERTSVFAWYNLVGSFATALGALAGGGLAQLLQSAGWAPLASYRVIVVGYGVFGILLAVLFLRLSPAAEAPQAANGARPGRLPVTPAGPANPGPAPLSRATNPDLQEPGAAPLASRIAARLGLPHSGSIILRLSSLFALDAFAGGFVIQSLVAYWFNRRFGVPPAVLGGIFFGANVLAGISALTAARVAARFGLINTMVFTHIPSNILLILVPLMPTLPLAILCLLLRFSISQMDVPTRQSYTMAVVRPEERSAAAGVTGVARTTGAAISPSLTGIFLANPSLLSLPFFLSGGLKIVYDLLLYRSFRSRRPPEEENAPGPRGA